MLARGAALRFLLTRLFDWLNVPAGALVVPKDPLEYYTKLRFHRSVGDARAYGSAGEREAAGGDLDGRRLLGQSRAGRLGRNLSTWPREGIKAVKPLTTNNRMELTAAIAALEALKRPRESTSTPTRNISAAASRLDRRLEAERLAHRRPEAGEERRSLAEARRRGRTPRRRLALGPRPRRDMERAGRRIRARGHEAVQAEAANNAAAH